MDIALGSLRSLIYRLMGMFFWALIGVITARALSVEGRGTYVSVVAIIGTVAGFTPSFTSAAAYYVSNKKRSEAEVASNGALLVLAAGVIQLAACVAGWAFYQGEGRALFLVVGVALFPGMARGAISGVFLGTSQVGRYNFAIYGQAYASFAALLVWVVLLGHRTTEGAVVAFIAGDYLSLAGLVALQRSWWGWLVHHPPDLGLMRGIILFGLVTGLSGAVGILGGHADRLLVPALDSQEGLGIYASAVALVELIGLVAGAVSVASYARVGALSRRAAADLTTRSVRHALPAVAGTALVVFVFAPLVIRVLYGSRYVDAAASLRILCFAAVLAAPSGLLGNYFVVQMGRPSITVMLAVAGLIVKAGLCVLLIPPMGYVGAAWATTASAAVGAFISTVLFLRVSGAQFRDMWRVEWEDILSYVRLVRRVLRGELFGRA
jgi:O-antigen/teichoic acid export membrane protein